jgi:hypothetical protein
MRTDMDHMCHFRGWSLANFNSLAKPKSFHQLKKTQDFALEENNLILLVHFKQYIVLTSKSEEFPSDVWIVQFHNRFSPALKKP